MTENEPLLPPEGPVEPPPSRMKLSAKASLRKLKSRLSQAAQNLDAKKVVEWVSGIVHKRGVAFYGTLFTLLLSTYFLADITALLVDEAIPEPPPSRTPPTQVEGVRKKAIGDYNAIFTRNLFNSQGLIPGEDIPSQGSTDLGGPAVRTTLPLRLIGTLVFDDESLSIATIEDRSDSQTYPLRVDEGIANKIRVVKVEARKVTFVNLSSGRREFVDLPEDEGSIAQVLPTGPSSSGGGIEKVGSNQFAVSRTEVDKALADFNNILTQARAVPNFENGVASGYKLFQIVPGSIYDKLGLQNGDVITGLNGSPINDPAKAFEMMSELKTSSHLELQVKKDGRPMTYVYDIH